MRHRLTVMSLDTASCGALRGAKLEQTAGQALTRWSWRLRQQQQARGE